MFQHSAQGCDPVAGAWGKGLLTALPLSSCKTLRLLELQLLYHALVLSLSLSLSPHGQKMEPRFLIETLQYLN